MADDYNYEDLESLIAQRDELDARIAAQRQGNESWRTAEMQNELASPLSPTEYDAAYRGPDILEEQPVGEALAAQSMVDEINAPPTPNKPGNYALSESGDYMPDPNAPYSPEAQPGPMISEDDSPMDFGRGAAYTDMVGNNFYSPYKGGRAGEAISLPENLQGQDFEDYQNWAEGGDDALLMAAQDAHEQNKGGNVWTEGPAMLVPPEPEMQEEKAPMIAPEEDERKRERY